MTVTLCFDVEGGLRLEGDTLPYKNEIKTCGYSWFPRAKMWGVPNTRGREKPSRNIEQEQKRLSRVLGIEVETRIILPESKNEAIEARIQMLENKLEYQEEHAKVLEEQSNALGQKSMNLSQVLPFGQPILVGHHSEQKHRNHIQRMHCTMGKAVELGKLAEKTAEKALANEREIERLKAQLVISTEKRWENVKALVAMLKKCNQIKSMRQNYKGTGSKVKIQYFLSLVNGESEELWIEHGQMLNVSFGGVIRTRLFGTEFESDNIEQLVKNCTEAIENKYTF
jgi:hypothetical protein